MSRYIFLLFALLSSYAHAQKDDYVQVLNADRSVFAAGGEIISFSGNVAMVHQGTRFFCDTGYQNKTVNITEAYGNVIIVTRDSVVIQADSLFYNGNSRKARLKRNVVLSDGLMQLSTEELFYDFEKDIATYYTKATITNNETVLSSLKGTYYHQTADVFFRDDVVINDPQYHLLSDTLQYNMNTERARFYGNTRIFNDSSIIFCNSGWYDTRKEISAFGKSTSIVNPPQTIFSDSLYYENDIGRANLYSDFLFIDSAMQMNIGGKRGIYLDQDQFVVATEHPVLTYYGDVDDTLFLTADTLKTLNYTQDDMRYFYAYYHVKLYRNDIQGVCDSLFFTFRDSTFRMYKNPIVWNEKTQMLADTIFMFTHEQKIEEMQLRQNAFIISESGDKYFDQVKGNNVTGYFDSSALKKMYVEGSAETIYFGKDDNGKYEGLNKAKCGRLWMHFSKEQLQQVVFLLQPEGVFLPMKEVKAGDEKLNNFNWQPDKRPIDKNAVLLDSE